MSTKTKA